MPILDIEVVASESTQNLPSTFTQFVADEAAKVFGTPQGTVWVKVKIIPSEHYAEDHGTPLEGNPVFVSVLKSRIPESSTLKEEIAQLTQIIAKALNRSDTNIHILYQSDGAGRVSFGGKLVE